MNLSYKDLFDFENTETISKHDKDIKLLVSLFNNLDKKLRKAVLESVKVFTYTLNNKQDNK